MSTNISLNSFIKGGNTKTIDIKKIIVNNNQTNVREKGLDILNIDLNLLQRLQIIFAITSEHIINKRKSLRLQNINKPHTKIKNLYRRLLFNL